MMVKEISSNSSHKLPADLKKALQSNKTILTAWKDITPIARNEYICWVTSAKKSETRGDRIRRTCEELMNGKRRPCCWPGCPHRNPNAKKWFKK